MTRSFCIAVCLPLCITACGAGSAESDEHATLSASPSHGSARQPRDRDIIVQTSAATPVGPIHADRAHDYPIRVTLVNASRDAIETWAVWVRASVYRDGQPIAGCASNAERAPATPRTLGPGESVVVAVPLPCALEEPGSYEMVGDVDVDEPSAPGEGALAVAEGSSAQQVVIDGALSAFGTP